MYTTFRFQIPFSIVAAFILLISQQLHSQELLLSDSLRAVLNAKEQEMFAVISSGSKGEAEKLIADDYITINADGVMEGKEKTIKSIGKFKGTTARLSGRQLRMYDHIAIINGRARFYLKQVLVAEILYTEIWDYRNSRWQFIGWQGTMTGLPSYYPVIITIFVILLLYLVIKLMIRVIQKRLK